MASAPLATQHGITCVHDPEIDTFSATIRCHDANGEFYYLSFRRDEVVLVAYSDNTI